MVGKTWRAASVMMRLLCVLVAVRARKAFHKAKLDRVGAADEHDGDFGGRFLCRKRRWQSAGHNHSDGTIRKLEGHGCEAFIVALGMMVFDHDIAPAREAQLFKP
jgi:hypothetical protein